MSGQEQTQRHVGSVVLPGGDDRRHRPAQLSRSDEFLEFGDAAQERQLASARLRVEDRAEDDILAQGQIPPRTGRTAWPGRRFGVLGRRL